MTISSSYSDTNTWRGLGTTSTTGYRGDLGNVAYNHSQATHAPTNATTYSASGTHTGQISQGASDSINYLYNLRTGHVGHTGWAGISHRSASTGGTYSLIQSPNGHSLLNSASGYNTEFRINNSTVGYIGTAGFYTSYKHVLATTLTDGQMLTIGSGAWAGPIGFKSSRANDAWGYFQNVSSSGYGCHMTAGSGGRWVLQISDYQSTTRFKFFANGSSTPSGMSDIRNKMDINAFSGDALSNMLWMSDKLKTFRFSAGLESKAGEEPTANDLDDSVDVPIFKDNWHTGFLAQDILASGEPSINKLVLSHVPRADMTERDRYYLDYEGITSQLVAAVAQLEARISALES